MKTAIPTALLLCSPIFCQQNTPSPIYRVTVTERTVKAINYQYRNGPTLIDFRGTVLMPKAKGSAWVDSKAGRAEIDAHLENLGDPQQFGREYLTYVLWALTPDGRPHNLGELLRGHSDKSHLRVTTETQAFAMIVTAEPYSSVRQPSDVVVLENAVRPDTVGKIEEVEARYELLPRGQYAWQKPEGESAGGPKVSMRKYEELLEIYQAQNAVGIAKAAGAEQYAPNTFAKAQQLLTNAQQLEQSKGDSSRIIQDAREASETAEDARVIAERRQQQAKIEQAQEQIRAAEQAQAQAQAELERAKEEARAAQSEAEAARARADAERAARERAEADAAAARARSAQPRVAPPASNRQADQSALRMRLFEQLNGMLPSRDTPRGLIVTVANSAFSGAELRDSALAQVTRIAALIAANPGLRVEVEGHAEGDGSEQFSLRRAEAVRSALVRQGVAASSVSARGLGNTRPIAPPTTAAGREANQCVEIVIAGDPIGTLPFWDHTYSLEGR
jgi:outer membrane protein OmpA-like peptidoglycan-associated protein